MAILPISSVSVKNNSRLVPFGMRNDEYDDNNGEGYNFPRRVQNKMVTVPLATLIAMSPMVGNANEPAGTLNSSKIVELAEANPAPEVDEATYVMGVDQSSAMTPAQRDYFKIFPKEIAAKFDAGRGAYIVFRRVPNSNNKIMNVDFVPRNVNTTSTFHVPQVKELVYHNIGKDKEYCGVKTSRIIEENGVPVKIVEEHRISDDAANQIIDLISGESKYQNSSKVIITETFSPNLAATKKYR